MFPSHTSRSMFLSLIVSLSPFILIFVVTSVAISEDTTKDLADSMVIVLEAQEDADQLHRELLRELETQPQGSSCLLVWTLMLESKGQVDSAQLLHDIPTSASAKSSLGGMTWIWMRLNCQAVQPAR